MITSIEEAKKMGINTKEDALLWNEQLDFYLKNYGKKIKVKVGEKYKMLKATPSLMALLFIMKEYNITYYTLKKILYSK